MADLLMADLFHRGTYFPAALPWRRRLTLIVTLYDHYRPIHDQHVALAAGEEETGPLDERGASGLAVEGRD